MLDEQASAPNPYAALLNDPDPTRSLGAMRIMMESGDPALIDIALEHGLLSSSETIRNTAFEYYAATLPLLSFAMNGKSLTGNDATLFSSNIISRLEGQLDTDQVGYYRLRIGKYNSEKQCFLRESKNECLMTFSVNGIFLSGNIVDAKLEVSEDGVVRGMARMYQMNELVPFEIRLLP